MVHREGSPRVAGVKFEEALTRLEEIVRALEKGDLSLEESLKRFEEGVKLSKSCMKMLEEAERKVEILLAEKDGSKRAQPFSVRRSKNDRAAAELNQDELEEEEEEDETEEGEEGKFGKRERDDDDEDDDR